MEEVPSLWVAVSFFQGGPGAAQSPRSWATEECAVFYVLGLCLPLMSFLSFQNCSSLTVARTPCLRLFRASAVADRQTLEGYVFLSRLSSLTALLAWQPQALSWMHPPAPLGLRDEPARLSAPLGLRDEPAGLSVAFRCHCSPTSHSPHQQASCTAGSSGASPRRVPTGGTASLGLLVTSEQAWPLRSRVWGKNHPHAASGGKRLYCFPLSCSPSLKTKV